LTCAILGIPLALLIQVSGTRLSGGSKGSGIAAAMPYACVVLALLAALKLTAESALFLWLRARTRTPLKRTALLMTGRLARVTTARFALGALGGLLLPAWLALDAQRMSAWSPGLVLPVLVVVLLLNFWGELLERYLFFAAVVAPKMPGTRGS
jgi:DMSO reductase anchor subunit